MRRAFNALKNGRPGPVMVEVPADVMTAEFAGNEVDYTAVRRTRSAGDPRDIDDAIKMLIEAKSPIVVAGQGVLYAEASAELVALAELLDIPVMTTTDGKSAFPEDHALALGSGGVVYTGHGRHFLLEADVIFAIGTSLTRHNISTPIIPPGKTIIHATNDTRDLHKANETAVPILGDAKLILAQMIEAARDRLGGPNGFMAPRSTGVRQEVEKARGEGVGRRGTESGPQGNSHRPRALGGTYANLGADLGGWSERVANPGEVAGGIRRARKVNENGRAALPEFITSPEPAFPHRRGAA